jgi:hypothetical protein
MILKGVKPGCGWCPSVIEAATIRGNDGDIAKGGGEGHIRSAVAGSIRLKGDATLAGKLDDEPHASGDGASVAGDASDTGWGDLHG